MTHIHTRARKFQCTITTRARVCHAESRAKWLLHTRTVAADLCWVDVRQIRLHPRAMASSVTAHMSAYIHVSLEHTPTPHGNQACASSYHTILHACSPNGVYIKSIPPHRYSVNSHFYEHPEHISEVIFAWWDFWIDQSNLSSYLPFVWQNYRLVLLVFF